MSTIKMAEAVKLQDTLDKKINELIRERNQNATQEIDKGEQADTPARSVDVISDELTTVRGHLRELKDTMRKSNITKGVVWNGDNVSLIYALDLVKDIRTEASEATALGNRKKNERKNAGFGQTAATFQIALYEPTEYRERGQKLLRLADKLSMLIQEANLKTEITVPFAGEYMIVE